MAISVWSVASSHFLTCVFVANKDYIKMANTLSKKTQGEQKGCPAFYEHFLLFCLIIITLMPALPSSTIQVYSDSSFDFILVYYHSSHQMITVYLVSLICHW